MRLCFNTMQVALLQNTENLSIEQDFPTDLSLGKDTEVCINMGILASMQGFLLSTENYMQSEFNDYRIFIGGGHQGLLKQHIQHKNKPFANLVLEGMLAYVEQQATYSHSNK
ncbi:hypothetical protein RS130_03250 [Paraglaciecola aquimarina]|uniref:Pantothenate kinase n=1 Tax=Paraglaciecola aquimarina TaxID=1235557 RepID=A0ABU3SST9_9ALTE|nr:hypothetical protein [Paraglaciecola aquimarina]MDU0353075.1 hypothetical protein [Paraglaciecola aquimarina]